MTEFKVIKDLIFAYEDDRFNRPEELMFIKEQYPNTVEMVSYNCGKGHNTGYNDCKISETKKIIKRYLENQK